MTHETKKKTFILFTLTLLLARCAADPLSKNTDSINSSSVPTQTALSKTYIGGRISFNIIDFYSLSYPNPATFCAGDANTFYDPLLPATIGTSIPKKLPQSLTDPSTTIRPAFIKNVSVDLSDANAPFASNNAFSCSLGSSVNAPPVSDCSTFDYGSLNGIPTTLSNSLLIIGGIQSKNAMGIQSSIGTNPTGSLAMSCGSVYPSNSLPLSGGGVNSCGNAMYGLAINSLPASAANGSSTSLAPGLSSSTVSISTWADISHTSTYSGPPASAGGSLTYNNALSQLLFFGGAIALPGSTKNGTGSQYSDDTWIYNLNTQKWTQTNSNKNILTIMQNTLDINANNQLSTFSKIPGGRSVFGYVALSGVSIRKLSQDGTVQSAGIDTTDRIFIIGGYGFSCPGGVNTGCTDILRFNPTYAPEYFDVQTQGATWNNYSSFSTQWIDSYHTQIVMNANTTSQLLATTFPPAFPLPSQRPTPPPSIVNFAIAGLNNHYSRSQGRGDSLSYASYPLPPFTPGTVPSSGSGYLVTAGGFYGYNQNAGTVNIPNSGQTQNVNGGLQIAFKWLGTSLSQNNEENEIYSSTFTSVSNYSDYTQATPLEWVQLLDNTSTDCNNSTAPFYGGGHLLKGLNIPLSYSSMPTRLPSSIPTTDTIDGHLSNQVVYFGGATCLNYLTSSASCPNWIPTAATPIGNPGRYWIFGPDPAYTFYPQNSSMGNGYQNYTTSTCASSLNMGGNPPMNAGMAAARGLDSSGNPIIVAWGGMNQPSKVDATGTIYYLYNNNKTPTWTSYTQAPNGPIGLGNASLVYSHVTGNFYLFGGVNPLTGTSSNTWQLSMTNPSSGPCGLNAGCTFTWKLLTTATGMTCYPNCPPARRSHRMVEANYHYFNPPFEPHCSHPENPCSFGIFMEGGTPDGVTLLSDRWMFDPTANGNQGHWQLMGELPPRVLSSLVNVDYYLPATGKIAHRAVLFGGETGMQNPPKTGNYFIPPTLGDTWMFDFETLTWNRVTLYGNRYDTSASSIFTSFSQNQAIFSSYITDTNTTFSPPPTSGGLMVTRTLSKPNHSASDTAKPLVIPEVFFMGGRTKDGKLAPFDTVYKFCSGSSGEKPYPMSSSGVSIPLPDDASCDSYDALTNPNSTSPSTSYVGRWLVKKPTGISSSTNPSNIGSFMGAIAYDSVHDLIITYGGLVPSVPGTSITQTTTPTNVLYEYTPPSAVNQGPLALNGTWTSASICDESILLPAPRYGHSMGYDAITQSLIIVGGYNDSGSLLTYTPNPSIGSAYTIPEVWSATRIDQATPLGIPSLGIPPITLGPFPCYYWSQITVFGNVGNGGSLQTTPETGLAHASSVFIPSNAYNSGFYTTNDNNCIHAGPIASTNSNISKRYIGGTYFDIDRSQLGSNENLLLNLTIYPLGIVNTHGDQSFLNSSENAIFYIHLIETGQSGNTIREQIQPRSSVYGDTTQYSQIVKTLSMIAPPNGQIRQEQIIIPISVDPRIDRIRVERYSGNAILIDATLFRMSRTD